MNEPKIEVPWHNLRKHKLAKDVEPPKDWPAGVVPISMEGLSLFGINEATGQLYWDGDKIETKFSLSARDRFLAIAVAASTASMAIVDLFRFAYGQ
jgi:hypothetical protein